MAMTMLMTMPKMTMTMPKMTMPKMLMTMVWELNGTSCDISEAGCHCDL